MPAAVLLLVLALLVLLGADQPAVGKRREEADAGTPTSDLEEC